MTRIILLVLWICLLPLRGWTADLMALEKLGGPAQAASTASAPDCHEAADHHAASADPEELQPSQHDSAHAEGECSDCTACEVCHAHAMAPRATPARLGPADGNLPQATVALHASAVLAPGFKPPIA